ncbi:2OG-Fe(II) oxygenase [Rhodovastum atsumiense]|uniref:2OG-Fe(II) oxygenase n=1 Tax=Rhodovastum atsumiense TaxID=504468 RepID=A0A5M6IQK5_9PROT|nr:2OG-Fe(II) oxygenase [Rhodovastum atsumiense]KAA5610501.1 2OG-Fe(II) oxygenase [Rhodovastum atsumiense]CAH2600488.1 2OG-Fe(II) oxygenase [Rhodovastum atsumiense]
MRLAYDLLETVPIAGDPFPHLLVPGFVPAAGLVQVRADLPPISRRGSFPLTSLTLGPAAAALMRELADSRFRDVIARRFGLDLRGAATMLTLRGRSGERDGRIHCDSTAKRVTILLYLNPEQDCWARQEGCLRLLRGPDDIENYAVEVPPTNGTLLVFPNGPAAWHGHRQYVGQRYVVQLNYMANDRAARAELRRHRISAFFKRLRPAA